MMILTPENIVALIMVFSLIVYVLTGGADFGGGVWDLLARGKRGESQRNLIAHVLAPIWEANHIWLILLIVLMFVCFPKAYALLLTLLHFPVTAMLFGIVLRGSAFVFRKYDDEGDNYKKLWSLMFAIGSIVTPFFLGLILGAITIHQSDPLNLVSSWLTPFPLFTGVLTLVICAFLAAVYLTNETSDLALQEDFRARALITGLVLLFLTIFGIILSYFESQDLFYELTTGEFALPLQTFTLISALATLMCLHLRKYSLGRVFACTQIVVMLFGWMITQYPDLITGQLTIKEAAAPQNVLITTMLILGVGSLILVPSFIYLYVVFFSRKRDSSSEI